jgi:WD40 repeat protein
MLGLLQSVNSLRQRSPHQLPHCIRAAWLIAGLSPVALAVFGQTTIGDRPALSLQTGHADPVISVSLSANGKWVASSTEHGPVKLWALPSGLEVRSFSSTHPYVTEIQFTGDSERLFVRTSSGGLDWILRTVSLGDDVKFTSASADGEQLAVVTVKAVEL